MLKATKLQILKATPLTLPTPSSKLDGTSYAAGAADDG